MEAFCFHLVGKVSEETSYSKKQVFEGVESWPRNVVKLGDLGLGSIWCNQNLALQFSLLGEEFFHFSLVYDLHTE